MTLLFKVQALFGTHRFGQPLKLKVRDALVNELEIISYWPIRRYHENYGCYKTFPP
jgi:hypothetical protein